MKCLVPELDDRCDGMMFDEDKFDDDGNNYAIDMFYVLVFKIKGGGSLYNTEY